MACRFLVGSAGGHSIAINMARPNEAGSCKYDLARLENSHVQHLQMILSLPKPDALVIERIE